MKFTAKLAAPLFACTISIGAMVIGGACVFPTTSNPPKLDSGTYVLTMINGQSPPTTFVDSNRTLRVFADTFIVTASTQFFDEHASVAITPRGGVQQPASLILIEHQSYTTPTAGALTFLITIYGASTQGSVLSPTSFQLSLPDHSTWRYDKR